jgi:Protein of unknown function (DUF3386)
MTTTTINNARDLFRSAYENRYTWDHNFPGYTADLQVTQGEEVYTAKVKINADYSVEVSGIDDEKVKESINHQLRDIVTHRQRSSFEKTHGKNEFSLGKTADNGAVEILVNGNAMGSHYQVRENIVSHVSRNMGKVRFVIDTQETLNTGSGYVPTRYYVIFLDTQTEQVTKEQHNFDQFTPVGNYYIMSHKVIKSIEGGKETITEFNFSNIVLL